MPAINIYALHNIYPGSTFYIIASGASMNCMHRSFFDDKLTITVNEAFRDWPCRFALMHHHENVQEAIDLGLSVITSEHDCGFYAWNRHNFTGPYYTYKHENNLLSPTINVHAIGRGATDELVMSACTTAEAIHFAALLGADNIVLCGVDGGMVDGQINYNGYNGVKYQSGGEGGTLPIHLHLTRPLLMAVINALRERGVHIYSMSPWVGFDLEGHKFESAV